MDPNYKPDLLESRTLFGLTLEQKRNDALIKSDIFQNVVTKNKNVSDFGLVSFFNV